MKKTIWICIDHRKIVFMWTKGFVWSLVEWRIHCKGIYPECYITHKTISF